MVVATTTHFDDEPKEGVILRKPLTKLFVNGKEVGLGTLFITEQKVVWGGPCMPTVTLLYPTISLHAVQKEPMNALYLILNYDLRLPNSVDPEIPSDDDDNFDGDDTPTITQLRFLPAGTPDVQEMFLAMNQGQALHPDPNDEVYEDLDDFIADDFMDGEEFDDDEKFEDAEESTAQPDEVSLHLRQLRLENANGHEGDGDIEEETPEY